MTMQDYVESLRDKHAFLEQQIDAEMHRPLPDQLLLSRLKREKLKIKDGCTDPEPVNRRARRLTRTRASRSGPARASASSLPRR